MEKEKQVVMGSLYDMNKTIVKDMPALAEGVINSKKEIIKNFITDTNNFYYMLLCNERKDYTLFDFHLAGGNVELKLDVQIV